METDRYTRVAITLHWVIAAAIIAQIASGLWMADAKLVPDTQALAFDVIQWHKSLGLTVLVLSLLRLGWRLTHRAPGLPTGMSGLERFAARVSHIGFYVLMIGTPLLGWVMVSVSIFGLPTIWFGLFEWPHLPGFTTDAELEKTIKDLHEIAGLATLGLLVLHVAAALKHHFVNRDGVLASMLPFLRRTG